MAMSLEELLAEEGFNRGRSKMVHRKSIGSVPLYQYNHHSRSGSSSILRKSDRAKYDIPPPYHLRGEFRTNDEVYSRKTRDNLLRKDRESVKDTRQKHEWRSSQDLRKAKKLSFGSSEDLSNRQSAWSACGDEIVEVEVHDNGKYDEVHSSEGYSGEGNETKYDTRNERHSFIPLSEKDIQMDKKYSYSSTKNLSAYKSFNDISKKSMKKPEASSQNSKKRFDESKSRKKSEQNVVTPALDEAAIRAIISILSGYAKRFLTDEDFRASCHYSSFASLNLTAEEEGLDIENKVVANLEEAIEIVERAAEEHSNSKDLKKASLQLSVITGLNSNDLKDGHTSGVPNCQLSACAHLYLAMIYKLQKKDRAAAKHLLQVFSDSPVQARMALLPDLWDQMFLPHLLHVKGWYDKEVDTLVHSRSNARTLELLEKVYNEILDSGTYLFAAYYKDWLSEGAEAPLLPSIQIPSAPAHLLLQEEGLDDQFLEGGSHIGILACHPVVSKNIYNAVFRHSIRPGTEVVDCEEESFDISARSSHYAALDENSSSEIVKCAVQDAKPEGASHLDHMSKSGGAERSGSQSYPEKICQSEKWSNCQMRQYTSHAKPIVNANEIILKKLAKGVFQLPEPEKFVNYNAAHSASGEGFLLSELMPTAFESHIDDLQGKCEYFDGGNFFSSVPQDFICPLTELILEDPVTLETGQTFERSAITKWFGKGNRKCPVTGRTLECQSVPLTNFIVRRVINQWKLEHQRSLMDLTHQLEENVESKDELAVFILEQLFVTSTLEERTKNARELISLGGLHFLIRTFQHGNMEEETRILALLLSCILGHADCRNHIAKNIDKLSLLNLLHSKHLRSRSNAVSLLTELICLNRRKDAKCFLGCLRKEDIMSAMHALMSYLQSCRDEQKPEVAMLLLHFDLLVEPQKYSVYREEAVDAISLALESSLYHEMVREKSCRALLVLGGNFSSAGKIMTEDWILKQAGFLHGPLLDSLGIDEAHESILDESSAMVNQQREDADEEEARGKWLANLSTSLLGDGSKSFLETLSRCLVSGVPDLVRVCLTTAAWLSSSLTSLSDAEFQLSAFSALVSGLKVCLKHGELVEHRILASMSLLNLSKFSECRLLLMMMAEDIATPLQSLEEVTWTAKELCTRICT